MKVDPFSNIVDLDTHRYNRSANDGYPGGSNGGGDGGDMDGDVLDRVNRLETETLQVRQDTGSLKVDVSAIRAELTHFATKADLADVKGDLIKWIVGTAIAMSTAGITVMAFVLNNATQKQMTAQPQPPIIINVPSPQPTAPPNAAKPPKP